MGSLNSFSYPSGCTDHLSIFYSVSTVSPNSGHFRNGSQRRFERPPPTSALPLIPDVLLLAANDVQGQDETLRPRSSEWGRLVV